MRHSRKISVESSIAPLAANPGMNAGSSAGCSSLTSMWPWGASPTIEVAGEVRQALSVVKKRRGYHERTIRELRLTAAGIQVGEPLRRFHGVLTGVPELLGVPESSPQVSDD